MSQTLATGRVRRPGGDGRTTVESSRTPAVVVAVLALGAYLAASWVGWRRRESPSWDLAIFTQLARRYAHLQVPVVDVKGAGFDLLGDHFHPLLVLLGVPYAVAPSAFTLLVVQAVLFAWSVWVLTRDAMRGIGPVAGVGVGAAYAVSFGLANAVAVQFHEIAFAVPLLALSLVAWRGGRWWACVAWAAPLVFVKEDLGWTVVAIAGLLAWAGQRRLAALLAGWGVAWFVAATAVVIPALNPHGEWAYGGKLDVGELLTHPWQLVTGLVDDPRKVLTLTLLLAVTGGIGLRSPVLAVAAPTLLWRFWSTNYGYWGPTWHYSAVLMPIPFVALVDGTVRARRSGRAWVRDYAVVAPAIAVTVAVMLVPQGPLARLTNPASWQASTREASAAAVLALVPAGASVETDIGLMTYLVDSHDVYYVANPGNPATDYVLLDAIAGGWSADPGDAATWAQQHHPGTTYQVVYDAGGYRLAHRTG